MSLLKIGLSVIVLSAGILSGCGGDSLTESGGSSETSIIDIGNGTGSSFTSGTLSIGVSSLSAGGSTSVTANLVDTSSSNSSYLTEVDVNFTSTCVGTGRASLTTPVASVAGTAISTYSASGCVGTDTITAYAVVDGQTITATGTVTVASASVGGIQNVSVSNSTISLKGTGGTETSTVTFKVVDGTGGPVSGQTVNFALSTIVGGVALSSATAVSGNDGLVSTIVQSGTVATGVQVTASIASPAVSSQVSLTISTAIPDQDSISLSASVLNPEAWDTDGDQVTMTVRMADRNNNPAPDGTAAYFTTEGGSIQSNCTTVGGACSVIWTSQSPRPAGGRATVMVTATGEESFTDVNANGVFDDGDSFTDMPEAFRDDDENFVRGALEVFQDFNSNSTYDVADSKFNGVLCAHSTDCSTTTSIHVRDSVALVMSGSSLGTSLPLASQTLPYSASIDIYDVNGAVPPAGTVITVAATNGTLNSPSSYTVFSTNDTGAYSIYISVAADTTPSSGTINITMTTPNGIISYDSVDIAD